MLGDCGKGFVCFVLFIPPFVVCAGENRRTHVTLAVGEEAKQRPGLQVKVYCRDIFFFVQCIIKQLLDSVL